MENNKNTMGIVVAVLALIILGLVGFIVYDKIIDNNAEQVQTNGDSNNDKVNNGEIDESQNKDQIVSLVQVLDTNYGKFIITTNGEVYFDTIYDNSELGKKQQYDILEYKNIMSEDGPVNYPFEGYKINLSNIQSAYDYYFGNGDISRTIVFLSKEGKVSVLKLSGDKSIDGIKFEKNIEKYNDIISVVSNSSVSGNSAILIDKNSNKYNFSF